MMFQRSAVLLLVSAFSSLVSAFSTSQTTSSNGVGSSPNSFTRHVRVFMTQEEDSETMRLEIEEMRQEAIRRIDALNLQKSRTTGNNDNATTTTAVQIEPPPSETTNRYNSQIPESKVQPKNAKLPKRSDSPSLPRRKTPVSATKKRDEISLLDNTNWKIMLNIGREEARSLLPENAPTTRSGTWMPKTWGISGERLLLSLELEFTPNQLTEKEEFLNGITGAKVLHVVKQELTLGPSMKFGSRTIPVVDGGWRVCRGEGPLGTDILRFFFEVAEEVRHQGGDVYCPAGRVYCTCGYFPQYPDQQKVKEELREAQESLRCRYEQLSNEIEADHSIVSWEKVTRTKELLQIRVQAGQLAERMNKARVRQPDKNLLRLSTKGDIGLTREGGVCCKVPKGLLTDYNILGKFGIGSVEKRTAEELLP